MQELQSHAGERGVTLALELPEHRFQACAAIAPALRQVLAEPAVQRRQVQPSWRAGGAAPHPRRPALAIEVRDTGLGMSQAQVEKLFEPFNRLGRESSMIEGTGIGLVISRSLVELMGGHLEVASRPDLGSSFRFSLPLQDAAAGEEVDETSLKPSVVSQALAGHVLYTDDDEVNRLLMQAYFGLMPAVELTLASDGFTGLALARELHPDLILIDLMMPGMSGREMLAAVRADPSLAATLCIAVSANAMPEEIEEALTAGFDGYLTKPLSATALLSALQKGLPLPVRASQNAQTLTSATSG